MLENVEKVQERLKSKLTPKRYIHTTGVRYTAAALAMRYGLSVEDASMAGVLHDCAKCFSDDELVRKCLKNNLECTEQEAGNLMRFYCMYQFTPNLLIASLEKPDGRRGINLAGKEWISRQEILDMVVFGIEKE